MVLYELFSFHGGFGRKKPNKPVVWKPIVPARGVTVKTCSVQRHEWVTRRDAASLPNGIGTCLQRLECIVEGLTDEQILHTHTRIQI